MMNKTRKVAIKVAAIVMAAGLLSACAAADTPAKDTAEHVFVVALTSNPPHFNMGLTTDGSSQYVSRALFNPLVNLNEQFEVVPGLAKSWTANDESTEFTFKLEENAKWHDGEPFTSADVKFYFDEIIPVHPLATAIAALYDETLTPDEHTAVVKLTAPYGPFFASMTPHYMLPAHLYAGTDILNNPANLKPVGTGPFKFVSFVSGDTVEVTKSDDYWGKQGDVDKIVYKVMPDANARALAYQSGEVDLPLKLPIVQIKALEKDPRFEFANAVMAEHLFMFYNTASPILTDPAVRKALFHAIDREAISEKVYLGTATPSRALMPNQVKWAIDPSTDYTKTFKYDPDEANKMLDKAGAARQADGTRFTVRLSFRNDNPTWTGTAELIKANLEKVGVGVELVSQEPAVYGDSAFAKHDFDLTLAQFGAYADPTLGTARAYVCNPDNIAYRNPSGVCDPAVDAAFTEAAATPDQDKRVKLFAAAAKAEAEVMGTAPLVSIVSMEAYRGDKWGGIDKFTSLEQWDWSALVAK